MKNKSKLHFIHSPSFTLLSRTLRTVPVRAKLNVSYFFCSLLEGLHRGKLPLKSLHVISSSLLLFWEPQATLFVFFSTKWRFFFSESIDLVNITDFQIPFFSVDWWGRGVFED